MSLLTRIFGQRRTAPAPDLSPDRVLWFRVPGAAEIQVSHEEALRISAVWACVTVIAKAIASCDWSTFYEDRQGNREPRRDTATWFRLNVRPNDEMTAYAWREAMLVQALIGGNGYSEIERTLGGAPAALWPLDPKRTCIERDPATGRLVAHVTNWGRGDTILPYEDLFHLHGPSIDGIAGYDTVTMALKTLAHARVTELFGLTYFTNGGNFGLKVKSKAKLTDEQRRDIRGEMRARNAGPENAHGIFFAEGDGSDIEVLSVNNQNAQFVETRHFVIEETCRWFGVPPHKVAHLHRSTFSNIEHQGLEFVRDALTPWCERMRQEADWKLLPTGSRLRTRIDTEWLSEGDAMSKSQVDASDVLHGLATPNEVRRRRGRNTVPAEEGGDTLFVQQQMVPLRTAMTAAPEQPADDGEDDAALPAPAGRRMLNGNGHAVEH